MYSIEIIAGIVGCITLFLYAIRQLSYVFEHIFTSHARGILRRYTSNLPKSIVVGMIITLLLDSSSAVIILTIIFINAGTLDLRRGIGIALGANIGTTLQSQLFAFDIMEYSFVLLVIGIFHILVQNSRHKKYLSAIFYVGMLFYSLFLIGEFVTQPDIYAYIKNWLYAPDRSPIITAVAGGFFTVIIQSSGAMVGLTITLAKEGLLTSATGVAIMMGAELGTTSNTLIAAIGGKRHAVQLALFNLLFNVMTITLGLLFFSQFISVVELLFGQFNVPRQIANAHILFNIIGVLLILPFVNPYVWLSSKLVNSKPNKMEEIESLTHSKS